MLMSVIETSATFRLHIIFQQIGLVISILGLLVRNLALWTARRSFTHRLADSKRSDHFLVMHGIYGFIRHPGYAGWLAWAVGGQLLLGNLICTLLFTAISWNFFADRINHEDDALHVFFGSTYNDYKKRTPSGIPGIP